MSDAPPLLLLPGLMCDARVFAAQTSAFSNASALAGFGATPSLPEMAENALAAAPERFLLLGHSMGARVALEVWRRAPTRVLGLALVSTGVNGLKPGEVEKRHALRDLGRSRGMEALVDTWLPPMIAPANRETNRENRDVYSGIHAMCVEQGLAAYTAQAEALINRPEVESLLPTINCPTLVCTGAEDGWSPPDQHRTMVAAIATATLSVVEGAGHFLPVERPEGLNAAMATWMRRAAM
jgi:pimeloyl-ACP methyl ester carboxylesterase